MKKHLLLIHFMLLCATLPVLAQPTLTSSLIPVVGDSEVRYKADTTGILPGASGANITWNFSGLNINASPNPATNFVSPAGTPYAASYPNATFAATNNAGNYAYFQVTGQDLFILGEANATSLIVNSNSQKALSTPFTYNSTFTDVFTASFTSFGITYSRTGSITATGDGYGKLILPSGTYNNLLRVNFFQLINDVSTAISLTYNIQSYAWYDGVKKFPLFRVDITKVTTNMPGSQPMYSKSASVLNSAVGIDEAESVFTNFTFYPNPVNGEGSVMMSLKKPSMVKFSLINTLGQNIYSETRRVDSGPRTESIDMSQLPAGLYILKAEADDYFVQEKIMKN